MKIRWDGHSPIEGEPVTSWIFLSGRQFVFTRSKMWEVEIDTTRMVFPDNEHIQ